mgnify:CR=1 FL=1
MKDLAISAIMLAAGIGLCFVNAGLGVFIAVCALLMLFFYKTAYRREGENLLLNKAAMDVAHSSRESLKAFLDGKDVEPEVNKASANGGVIRLEVYYNADAPVAYAQLFDFSNYAYEAATGIVELRGEKAGKIISKL